jgi:hypothetical protein
MAVRLRLRFRIVLLLVNRKRTEYGKRITIL